MAASLSDTLSIFIYRISFIIILCNSNVFFFVVFLLILITLDTKHWKNWNAFCHFHTIPLTVADTVGLLYCNYNLLNHNTYVSYHIGVFFFSITLFSVSVFAGSSFLTPSFYQWFGNKSKHCDCNFLSTVKYKTVHEIIWFKMCPNFAGDGISVGAVNNKPDSWLLNRDHSFFLGLMLLVCPHTEAFPGRDAPQEVV